MRNVKILLVEDDTFLREIYSDIFFKANISIETAVDGEDAFRKISQGGWDLVLLDVILPKMTGIEIMRKLRDAKEPKKAKKIIFLTNLGDTKDINTLKELGDGHLIKSEMTPEEFIARVKGFLQ